MPYTAEIGALLAVDGVGLVLYSWLVVTTSKLGKNMPSPQRVALHGLPFMCNLLAIAATACQLFLVGRTESGCAALHRTAGNFYWIMLSLMHMYFMLRVILIHKTAPINSQRVDFVILGLLCIYFPIATVFFNLETWTFILPDVGVCLIAFSQPFVVQLLVLPTAFDVLINWRFLAYIVMANRDTGVRTDGGSGRIGRLIRITAVFFLFQTIFALVLGLMLFGAIPVPPGSQTVVFTLQMSVNAGSTIWPMIAVQCMKRVRHWSTTGGDLSDLERTTLGTGDAASKMKLTANQAATSGGNLRVVRTG